MSFVINTTINKTEHLFEIYKSSYDKEIYQDTVLIAKDGRKVFANKFVLAISSDLLENILVDYPNMSSVVPEILLPDVEAPILEKIVEFLYNGTVGIESSSMSDFVSVCNLLQIKGSINCVGR